MYNSSEAIYKGGGGRDEPAVYTINHLLFTTKLQKLQHFAIEKISQSQVCKVAVG